jgi:hypothetical protein
VAESSSLASRPEERVVLKRLDEDCLLDGQLHPSIRQRLERVRELPMKGMASLLGVERRDGGQGVAQLVWAFVPGRPLAEIEADESTWRRLCREVILAVEALHAAGIVHGAIHGRNVIVTDRDEIRLTHVSPLLYNDPDQDEEDVIVMLRQRVASALPGSALAEILSEAETGGWRLADLYAELSDAASTEAGGLHPVQREPRLRARAIALAGIAAMAGVGVAVGILWYLGRWPVL